ncbi:MAG TPA: ABC transporter substrate-binding protein [Bacteroidales bacterium]|nr:ABC transporter substrate-binding protein [Bacteroidales bacterium]HQL71143.1 ABC transporter substrate-binding protein [Bacteroidales bacterium]
MRKKGYRCSISLCWFIALIAISCNPKKGTDKIGEPLPARYAKGYAISVVKDGYLLKVTDPAQNISETEYKYTLSRTNEPGCIHIPVKKVICCSTSHVAFIDALGKDGSICAVSGAPYIYNGKLVAKIRNGALPDIGYGAALDLEKIITMKPDVVFAYGVDNNSLQEFRKIQDAGIPVVWIGEYLEPEMLGRTEWLKFFACFYDCLHTAGVQFDSIASNYDMIKNNVAGMNMRKPLVLTGLPFQGVWYVPGENSFIAAAIRDAGGELLLTNPGRRESKPLSMEEVFAKAGKADVWINLNNISSREAIEKSDSRFCNFVPRHKARIFNNNKRMSAGEGNDFWESGVVHPDKVLNDLFCIFHGENCNSDSLFYYRKL